MKISVTLQVLENLMYQYDPKNRTDDGIMRLCKEVKDKWGGSMIPSNQYGLNDAWNKMNQAEVRVTGIKDQLML